MSKIKYMTSKPKTHRRCEGINPGLKPSSPPISIQTTPNPINERLLVISLNLPEKYW